MYRILSDLRVLKMAQHLEDVFEAYEQALRNTVPEVPVRARLAALFKEGPGHQGLKTELARLSAEARRAEASLDSEDALQTLYECEMIAHDFYLHQLDHVSDPRLVSLFKVLAEEELGHAHAVSEAMRALQDLRRSIAHAPASPGNPVRAD